MEKPDLLNNQCVTHDESSEKSTPPITEECQPEGSSLKKSIFPALHITTSASSTSSDSIKSPATPSQCMTPAPLSAGSDPMSAANRSAPLTPSSVGQADLGGPLQQPPGDIAHDLPSPLLHAGWRKFWSKRENRPYFYNKNNGQSLWEMPTESNTGQHESPSNGFPTKRRSSHDGGDPGCTPLKRPSMDLVDRCEDRPGPEHLPGSLWNSRVVSNVTHPRRETTVFLPPNPQIEWERADLIARLRQQYVNSCKSREGIVPVTGSFNRWNLQMKVEDHGFDPVLPSKCVVAISESMKRELLFALPTPLMKPKYANEARNQLMKYAESAKAMVDTRNATPESRKTVKWNVDDTIRWLRTEKYLTFDDLNDRLAHLKRTCQPHIAEMAKDSVEKICLKVYTLSHEYAHHLREQHLQWLEKVGVQIPDNKKMSEHKMTQPTPSDENSGKPPATQYTSHPAPLLCVCPMASGLTPNASAVYPVMVDTNAGVDLVAVDFSGARFTLTRAHYDKLTQLYRRKADDDSSLSMFPQRLWCLLQRYQSYMGEVDGMANQAALPVPVFECLNRVFDVTFELFASPLNCYFAQFCSAFHDTDRYFGSCGPVLDFFPEQGSFEANPPFCEELLLSTVEHIEFLLENSSLALSFIVFMPDWRDPPYEALTRLENCRFMRAKLVRLSDIDYVCARPTQKTPLRAMEHEYRLVNCPLNSGQAAAPEVTQRSNHSTLIVFLQNDAGHSRWSPTPAKVKEIVTAYHSHVNKYK